MRDLGSKLRDEKGAAIVLVALSMVALLSAVALAVDVGMLVTARTEDQRAADSGAIAGAQILAIAPADSLGAAQPAVTWASRNDIRNVLADVRPEDVSVYLALSRVYVDVRRISERNNAVGTYFARIFGANTVNITAHAAAEAAPAGGTEGPACLLPIMLPDRWSEDGLTPGLWPTSDDSYDPPGSSVRGSRDDTPDGYDTAITGYDSEVIGHQIEIHKAGAVVVG